MDKRNYRIDDHTAKVLLRERKNCIMFSPDPVYLNMCRVRIPVLKKRDYE